MGDANTKYVPEGVMLLCSNGGILTQLICDPQPINLYGVRYADENDNKPEANIPSFTTCKTKGACAPPAPLKWIKVKENVTLHGFKPLLDESECICEYGQGIIKIFFDKYAAEVALEDSNESDFVKEPISTQILGMIGGFPFSMISSDFREGVGKGLKEGAQGTWNLLKDIWNKPGETLVGMAKGIGKMAVIGGVYLSNSSNPAGTIQSDMMLRSLDARYGTNFTQTRDGLAQGVEQTVTRAVEDVKHGNLKSIGKDVGQVEYAVAEAVIGTKGAGLVAKGVKTAAELAIGAERLAAIAAKSAEVLDKIKFGLKGVVRIGSRKAIRYVGFGGDIALDSDKTTTIIGKFTDLTDGAGTSKILEMPEGSFARGTPNKGGLNILDLPDAEYKKLLSDYGEDMGKEIFWQRHNQPFLEDAFKRGDNVRLLSNPDVPANRTGFYARELSEVQGYVDGAGNRVPGLAEKYGYEYNPVTKTYVKK